MTMAQDVDRYLELSKLKELREKLEADGYTVTLQAGRGEVSFDLVAEKEGHVLAYEVMARSRLPTAVDALQRLQRAAATQNIELRTVFVEPPRRIDVDVEALEAILFQEVVNEAGVLFDGLGGATMVDEVHSVQIEELHVRRGSLVVRGTAVVDVTNEHDGGDARDGVTWSFDFPLDFELTLDPADLSVMSTAKLEVDLAGFYE
jgi:hypothetical protein